MKNCPQMMEACNCPFYEQPSDLHCPSKTTTATTTSTTTTTTTPTTTRSSTPATASPSWPPTCPEWNEGFMDQFYHGCFKNNWEYNNNPCNCHNYIGCNNHMVSSCSDLSPEMIYNPCTETCDYQLQVLANCSEVMAACDCPVYMEPDDHCDTETTAAAATTTEVGTTYLTTEHATTTKTSITAFPTWPPTCREWERGFRDQFYDSCAQFDFRATNNPCNCHQRIDCRTHDILDCPDNLVFNPCTDSCHHHISVLASCPEILEACNCPEYIEPEDHNCGLPNSTTTVVMSTTTPAPATTTEPEPFPPSCPGWDTEFAEDFFIGCFTQGWDFNSNPCNCHQFINCESHTVSTCLFHLIFNPCTQRWE